MRKMDLGYPARPDRRRPALGARPWTCWGAAALILFLARTAALPCPGCGCEGPVGAGGDDAKAVKAELIKALKGQKQGHDHHHHHGGEAEVKAIAAQSVGDWGKIKGEVLHLKPTYKDCKEGHLGEVDAVVKAQRAGDTIAVQISWPDATRDDSHKSKVWDEKLGGYKTGKDREDRVALMFDMGGDFASCMLAGKVFRADVWHWKAARTGTAGLAHDKYHIYSLKPVHAKSRKFKGRGGKSVYIARISDAGDPLYSANKPPSEKTADRLPGYLPNPEAQGSIADVKAQAVHDGKGWTVTLTRKLATGHEDDVKFEKGRRYKVALACFNRSSDMHHSTASFVLTVE